MTETEAKPQDRPQGQWVMAVKKQTQPTEFYVYIGNVKIAEIAFHRSAPKWKCYMRLFGYQIKDYLSMSDALRDLHKLLKSPPPEGANVGNERQRPERSQLEETEGD